MRNYDLYARLELITPDIDPAKAAQPSRCHQLWKQSKVQLSRISESVLKYLCGSTEPSISTRRDRQGNQYFVAYDPVDCDRYTFSSEEELRVWLDERYYH